MTLNTIQQQVFDRVVIDKAPITYLVGEAGVGKSHTVSQIISHVPHILTATSHQAKSVLSQMTGDRAITVHSYFGYILTTAGYQQKLVKRDKHSQRTTTLLVIDEVSMLPDRILTDALEGLGIHYDQILFVGDPVQLPAVSNAPKLQKLEPYKIELTEQMRQASCPILSNYLKSFRRAIETDTMPASLFTEAPSITLLDSHRDFCREYILCEGSKRIIAYRNAVVDKYNANIVEGDTFNIGDIVVIDKPIGTVAKNQDQVLITHITDTEHYYDITARTVDGHTVNLLHYKKVSYVNSELEKLKSQHRKEAYWELYNSSFRLKHLYSSTIYKSQGTSVDYVFIDALDIVNAYEAKKTKWNNPISQDMFLRLLYVAVSRMRTHCYIYTGSDCNGRFYEILSETPEQATKNLSRPKRVVEKLEPTRFTID